MISSSGQANDSPILFQGYLCIGYCSMRAHAVVTAVSATPKVNTQQFAVLWHTHTAWKQTCVPCCFCSPPWLYKQRGPGAGIKAMPCHRWQATGLPCLARCLQCALAPPACCLTGHPAHQHPHTGAGHTCCHGECAPCCTGAAGVRASHTVPDH